MGCPSSSVPRPCFVRCFARFANKVNREALRFERLLVGRREALVGWTFPSEQCPGELEELAEKLPLQG